MGSLNLNDSWKFVSLPKGYKPISCKWIYKFKEEILGVQKFRFRVKLLAKGFMQKEDINHNEVLSLVVKQILIRVLISLVVQKDLELTN